MKLMKRILAIVCTFVMIISMATGVNAVDDKSNTATPATTETGSITLNNAVVGDTYKVYKILSLESKVMIKLIMLIHIRKLVINGTNLLPQAKVQIFLRQILISM